MALTSSLALGPVGRTVDGGAYIEMDKRTSSAAGAPQGDSRKMVGAHQYSYSKGVFVGAGLEVSREGGKGGTRGEGCEGLRGILAVSHRLTAAKGAPGVLSAVTQTRRRGCFFFFPLFQLVCVEGTRRTHGFVKNAENAARHTRADGALRTARCAKKPTS